jgi:hypothetical protein
MTPAERIVLMSDKFRKYRHRVGELVFFKEEQEQQGTLSYPSSIRFSQLDMMVGPVIEVSSGFHLSGENAEDLIPDSPPARCVTAPEQIQALVELGFEVRRTPNFTGTFKSKDPQELAEMCEEVFSIIGAPPSFNLSIEIKESEAGC